MVEIGFILILIATAAVSFAVDWVQCDSRAPPNRGDLYVAVGLARTNRMVHR